MKKKRPDFHELIQRFFVQINLRHESAPLNEKQKLALIANWNGKDELLYKKVLQMEQEIHRVVSTVNKYDDRVFECQIGVDVLGFPIYIQHNVRFERTFTKPSPRFSKKGSEAVSSKDYKFLGYIFKQH